jgi:phage gpG-like protein
MVEKKKKKKNKPKKKMSFHSSDDKIENKINGNQVKNNCIKISLENVDQSIEVDNVEVILPSIVIQPPSPPPVIGHLTFMDQISGINEDKKNEANKPEQAQEEETPFNTNVSVIDGQEKAKKRKELKGKPIWNKNKKLSDKEETAISDDQMDQLAGDFTSSANSKPSLIGRAFRYLSMSLLAVILLSLYAVLILHLFCDCHAFDVHITPDGRLNPIQTLKTTLSRQLNSLIDYTIGLTHNVLK